jgi:hypothetical protein
MPNTIKPSRSWVANYVPTALEANELAINWVDAKAFTRNPSGDIVSITLGGGGSSGIVTDTFLQSGNPFLSAQFCRKA